MGLVVDVDFRDSRVSVHIDEYIPESETDALNIEWSFHNMSEAEVAALDVTADENDQIFAQLAIMAEMGLLEDSEDYD